MANRVQIKEVNVSAGDLVRIHQSFKDKEKERVQIFDGRVIGIKGRAPDKTITIRKIGIDNIGVEKIFPVESPTIVKVEVKKSIPVRRAKLYYLREKK